MEEINDDFTLQKMLIHLKTILKHKRYVFIYCNKCKIPWQGLMHDLSKFSPEEFITSVKYATGNRSPIEVEKELYGYSDVWIHHKSHNKHHYEYWIDDIDAGGYCIRMPFKYTVETMCDRLAANMTYNKDGSYQTMLNYWKSIRKNINMHPDNIEFLDRVFGYLAAVERDAMFTIEESTRIERNGKVYIRSIYKRIKTYDDIFNLTFLELLYRYIVDKNGNPLKTRLKIPKDTVLNYY